MTDEPIVAEPEEVAATRPLRAPPKWTTSSTSSGQRPACKPGVASPRDREDKLGEDDLVELEVDFVRLSLSPLEFIQLASFLRMSIDGLLERHPDLQRAVVNAFDIRD